MGGESIEDLSAVCEVGFEREDLVVWEWNEIEIQDLVAFVEEIRNDMTTSFARATSEDDPFADGGLSVSRNWTRSRHVIELCDGSFGMSR